VTKSKPIRDLAIMVSVAALVVAAGAIVMAKADTITVTVTGHVGANARDQYNLFGGSIASGAAFTGTFVFDTSLAPIGSISPAGQYIYGGLIAPPSAPVSPALSVDLIINGHDYAWETGVFSELYTSGNQLYIDDRQTASSDQFMISLFNSDGHFPTAFAPFGFDTTASDNQGSHFQVVGNGPGGTIVSDGALFVDHVTSSSNVSGVPGPIVGAGLPGLLGAWLVGFTYFRRRRMIANAARSHVALPVAFRVV
jgi:hypothetical protein